MGKCLSKPGASSLCGFFESKSTTWQSHTPWSRPLCNHLDTAAASNGCGEQDNSCAPGEITARL